MNQAGLEAYETAHQEHLQRPTYTELYRIIVDAAIKHDIHCRLDALHFLALNFEFMVAEPLGHQRNGTMPAIMNGDVRAAIDADLKTIFRTSQLKTYRISKVSSSDADPSATAPSSDDSKPSGVPSGEMLQAVASEYSELKIANWRLWG